MSGVLVVAEVVDGRLGETTRELVSAASGLGGPITLGIAAEEPGDLVAAAAIDGVHQIATVRLPAGGFNHEIISSAVGALITRFSPEVVVLNYSIRSASFAAGLAQETGLGFAADIIELRREDDGEIVVVKPVYGGRVCAELGFARDVPVLVMVRPNLWPEAADGDVPTTVVDVELPTVRPRVRHVEYQVPEASDLDLRRAEVILAIGRGVGSQEHIATFAEIADRLGAMLGASRPIVDAGWLPSAHQVGQTGLTVKPKVYIAFGISGALQHLAGMHASKTIVAVNTDNSAPIFNIADVGAVADINEVADQIKVLLADQAVSS
jgi:electron transfer flavoprotein alpha subunit